MKQNQRGITIIGLLITIVVIVIIAGVCIYTGRDLLDEAKQTELETNILLIQAAGKTLYNKHTLDDSVELVGIKITAENKPTDWDDIDVNNNECYVLGKSDLAKMGINIEADDIDNVSELENKKNVYVIDYEKNSVIHLKNTESVNFDLNYQKVEYIESTGTQYIDTGIATWENGTRFELDIKFKSSTTRCLMGYGTNGGYYFGKNANDKYEVGTGYVIDLSATLRRTCNFYRENDKAYLSIDGTTISRTINGEEQTNFITWLSGYAGEGAIIYNIKAYKDNVLLRDMVPCYQKIDNVIGMYDRVNDVFYKNAGTGIFLKGKDILYYE